MKDREAPLEGAHQSRRVIKRFHAILNSDTLIPEQGYRRNHSIYPLVCYVNNIIGLFLSKNYDVIPVFVARAAEHMVRHPASPASHGYYVVVTRYLSQVVYHLISFIPDAEFDRERIPASIIDGGPQEPPEGPGDGGEDP